MLRFFGWIGTVIFGIVLRDSKASSAELFWIASGVYGVRVVAWRSAACILATLFVGGVTGVIRND